MKKIITLLVAVVAVTSVFAQTAEEKRRAKDKVFGNHKTGGQYPTTNPGSYPNSYPQTYPGSYPTGSREAAIEQVNREYDAKISSIQNNPYLSQEEKDRQIRQLNRDRQRRIQEINNQYGYNTGKHKDKRHHDDDDDDRNEGKGKGYGKYNNPGKHLGWEKGKGNPHRGRN